jgi:hypothetical protein
LKLSKSFIFSILSFVLWINPIYSEVKSVQVFWNHGACQDRCGKLLEEKLRENKQIDSAVVSITSNMADIQWNKNAIFSYQVIKRIFQKVGVGIDNVRIIVRGKITYTQDRLVLISDGDNTTFDIVSYEKERPNAKYLSIDSKLKQTYIDYSKEHKTLIIEGALYHAWRAPPLYLLLEKVTLEDEKKDTK